MIKYLIILISLILESILNIYINTNSYLVPLFTFLSLIFIYPEFKNSKKYFFCLSIILGIIYDILFTNFYILNLIVFFIYSFIIYYYFKKYQYNFINIIIVSVIGIIIYNLLLFIIFNIFNYYNYNLHDLLFIIKHFFIINIIYSALFYLIINKTKIKNIL